MRFSLNLSIWRFFSCAFLQNSISMLSMFHPRRVRNSSDSQELFLPTTALHPPRNNLILHPGNERKESVWGLQQTRRGYKSQFICRLQKVGLLILMSAFDYLSITVSQFYVFFCKFKCKDPLISLFFISGCCYYVYVVVSEGWLFSYFS